MNRNRSWYRLQRERAIRRKEHILLSYGGNANLQAWTNGQHGRLSKGKIHCSCWMCRRKSYDAISHRDAKLLSNIKDQLEATIRCPQRIIPVTQGTTHHIRWVVPCYITYIISCSQASVLYSTSDSRYSLTNHSQLHMQQIG